MGAGGGGQVEATAQGTALGVQCSKHHGAHAGLHQGTGTHRAGLQADQQGAAVEAPVAPQACRLPQGHQLGMAEGIALALPAVAAPADAATRLIQHHSRHRNLPAGTGALRVAQQPLHPLLVALGQEPPGHRFREWDQLQRRRPVTVIPL